MGNGQSVCPGGSQFAFRDAATGQRAGLRLGSARRRAPRGPRPEVRGSAARPGELEASRGFGRPAASQPSRPGGAAAGANGWGREPVSCSGAGLPPGRQRREAAAPLRVRRAGCGPQAAAARAAGGLGGAGGRRPALRVDPVGGGQTGGSLLPRAQASGRPEGTPADPGAATGTRGCPPGRRGVGGRVPAGLPPRAGRPGVLGPPGSRRPAFRRVCVGSDRTRPRWPPSAWTLRRRHGPPRSLGAGVF